MKRILLVLLTAVFLIGLIACKQNEKKVEEKAAPAVEQVQALEGVTVESLATDKCGCGMSLAEHAITDTVHYEGKVYGFCNSGCKENFAKDPVAAIQKMKE